MANPPTESELWFDDYLETNGYGYKREPELDVKKKPDRLIERAGLEALCEIKEFKTDAMTRRWPEGGSQMGTFSDQEWFLSVRRQISAAAEQLEPLAGRGWPLVIVLANPRGYAVPLSSDELMQAMYGELMVTFRIDTQTGTPSTDPVWTLGVYQRVGAPRGDSASRSSICP